MIHYRHRLVVGAVLALVLAGSGLGAQKPRRILAVGDVHGAHDQFVTILARAGLIDAQQRWTGGNAILVQTGDYTDRGSQVRQVLDLLMALEQRAGSGGGQVITLMGNHEVMNIIGDLRDVTPEIVAAFADAQSEDRRLAAWKQYEALGVARTKANTTLPAVYRQTRDEWMSAHPPGWLEYREALGPRGKYGRWLRTKSIAATVDGTLFMHAGISPDRPATADAANAAARREITRYEAYFQRLVDRKLALPFFTFGEALAVSQAELESASVILADAKAKGEAPDLSGYDVPMLREAVDILKISEWSILAPEGPLWFRGYAQWPEESPTLAKVLAFLDGAGIKRVVVGHTPQRDARITPRFDGRVVLIDTGMLPVYKGRPSALEIREPTLSAIYEDGIVALPLPQPVKQYD